MASGGLRNRLRHDNGGSRRVGCRVRTARGRTPVTTASLTGERGRGPRRPARGGRVSPSGAVSTAVGHLNGDHRGLSRVRQKGRGSSACNCGGGSI